MTHAHSVQNPLTPEQVCFFDENGYIVIPGFLSPEQVQQIRDAIDTAVKNGLPIKSPKHNKNAYGVDEAYEKIPAIAWLDSEPRLLGMLRQLLGGPIVSTNDSGLTVGMINKVWHKDNQYDKHNEAKEYEMDFRPDFKVVRIGFYLDAHQKHSGALGLKAGSHKIKNLDGGKPLMIRNGSGDLAIFDVRITHAGNLPVPRPGFDWLSPAWLRPKGYAYRDFNPMLPKAVRKVKMLFYDAFVRLPIFYPYRKDRIMVTAEYGADNHQSQRWSDNRTNQKGQASKKVTKIP